MARNGTAVLVSKDLRVLLPVWLGTAMAMTVLAATSTARGLGPRGAAVYALGSVALGAIVIGHEFRRGTMAALLAVPVRRGRLLTMKLAVLALLLGTLGALAWVHGGWVSPQNRTPGSDLLRSDIWFVLPLLCGLGLAPWFTLLTRSELGGMVFAGAVPAVLLIGGDILSLMKYGLTPDHVEASRALKWLVVEAGMVAASAIGLVGSARAFQRLQLVQNAPLEAWIPARRAAAPVDRPARRRPRNVWLTLLVKELRLQTPAVGLAALFVLGWLAASSAGETVSARIDLDSLRAGFAWFYVIGVALLIGATGSAEERQLGTLSSQLLIPMATWKQWSLKVAVLVGLNVVLAFLLPLLLIVLIPGPRPGLGQVPVMLGLTLVLGLPLVALYLSSLTTGGVRAFLGAIGVVAACSVAIPAVFYSSIVRNLAVWFSALSAGLGPPSTLMAARAVMAMWVLPLLLIVTLLLLGRFAMSNHRRLDNGTGRITRQLGWVAVMLILLVLCESAAAGLFRAAVVAHRSATTAAQVE